jgi:hypothetical protein
VDERRRPSVGRGLPAPRRARFPSAVGSATVAALDALRPQEVAPMLKTAVADRLRRRARS